MKSLLNRSKFAVYFLPGIIVLVFGMLALYSTVSLISSRQALEVSQKGYAQNIKEFYGEYVDFLQNFQGGNEGFDADKLSVLKENLKNINNRYALILKNEGHAGSDQGHVLYLIGRGIADMADQIIIYERSINRGEKTAIKESMQKQIHETTQSFLDLQNATLREYQNILESEEYKKKEDWLYWSVIIMGLSGFILTVLNGQKLYDLKRLHAERLQTYDTMHKRLAAMEMANDGIIIIEKDQTVAYFNASLAEIMDIQKEEHDNHIGKPWQDMFKESDCDELNRRMEEDLTENKHWIGEFDIYRPDGEKVPTEISGTVLPDGGIIATIQDISARQNAEREKKEIEEQFYQAQKMEAIGRLAGGIAHDFNNILAAMNGYAEFIMDDLEEGEEHHQFAKNIYSAGTQAKSLVDQVLTFSRRNETRQDLMDIVPVVKEVHTMLEATISKSIELTAEAKTPVIPVYGNANQISQIMMNLCVNAVDAMEGEHGEIKIAAEECNSSDIELENIYKDELPDPKEVARVVLQNEGPLRTNLILGHVVQDTQYAKVTVSDTGTGMSRSVMEHIFEPFFTTKSVDEGTGLGLATVHGVVVSHKGMMVIRSELGFGTVFDIYLPIYHHEDDESIDDTRETEGAPVDIDPTQKRILLVEDQDSVRNMMLSMIERIGYEVHYATDGLDGLEIIREHPGVFDLIITDYNMPRMSGLEMTQQISLDHPDLPVILLSGYSEEEMYNLLLDHPSVKKTLTKPASRQVLEKTISEVLSGVSA